MYIFFVFFFLVSFFCLSFLVYRKIFVYEPNSNCERIFECIHKMQKHTFIWFILCVRWHCCQPKRQSLLQNWRNCSAMLKPIRTAHSLSLYLSHSWNECKWFYLNVDDSIWIQWFCIIAATILRTNNCFVKLELDFRTENRKLRRKTIPL